MVFSLFRLFVYRIPILLLLIYVAKMDYTACGLAMFLSNFLSGVVELTAVLLFNARLPKKNPELFR